MSMDANKPIPQLVAKSATQTVNNSAAFVADTALTLTVKKATRYRFKLHYIFTVVNTSGVKVDLNGGTATMTSINGQIYMTDLATWAGIGNEAGGQITALTSAVGVTACGTLVSVVAEGVFLSNAKGTFVPRFAQNGAAVENTVAQVNSSLMLQEIA